MVEPIIKSLLDQDFYKFTMGQVVFRKFRDVNVKYVLKNRSKVNLSHFIKEQDLRDQLDNVMNLKFNNSELHYLRGTNEYSDRMFTEDYLEFLKNLKMPNYNLCYNNDSFQLEFEGSWASTIYWEICALSIINELFCSSLFKMGNDFDRDIIKAQGVMNLADKINKLSVYPDIVFTDFGTRRRFSREWQDYVVQTLNDQFKIEQFRGTSNVYLAMKYGLLPMGTSAHEMFMIMAGLSDQTDNGIKQSHNECLQLWWEQYGYGLSIALTDTFGSKFFFKDMTKEQAVNWKGLRHDSGDPIEFGESAIKFYNERNINPYHKILVFSDGLDVNAIIKIYNHFKGRINTTFGWGTNLTNDLGITPLSLVIKPENANGVPLVKLSDNRAKSIGPSDLIERYSRIFDNNSQYVECRY